MADDTSFAGIAGISAHNYHEWRGLAATEREELIECQRLVICATYGGKRAVARLSSSEFHDLIVDALLLLHSTQEQRDKRGKRQIGGRDPRSIPPENTLKNHWRNERRRASGRWKVDQWFGAAEAAAEAAADGGPELQVLAEDSAFGAGGAS